MVSEASKKKAAQKKAAAAAKRGAKAPAAPSSSSSNSKGGEAASPNSISIDAVAALNLSDRTCTGVLASHPLSRDIHVSIPIFLASNSE
jgi:ATP-binding cassette subfamily F protein 2